MNNRTEEYTVMDQPDDALPGFIVTEAEKRQLTKTRTQRSRLVSMEPASRVLPGARDISSGRNRSLPPTHGRNGASQTTRDIRPVFSGGSVYTPPRVIDESIVTPAYRSRSSTRQRSDKYSSPNRRLHDGYPGLQSLDPNFIVHTETDIMKASELNQNHIKPNRITIVDEPMESRLKKKKHREYGTSRIQGSSKYEEGFQLEDRNLTEAIPMRSISDKCAEPRYLKKNEAKKLPILEENNTLVSAVIDGGGHKASVKGCKKRADNNSNKAIINIAEEEPVPEKSAKKPKRGKFAALVKFVKRKDKNEKVKKIDYCKVHPFDDGSIPIVRNAKQLEKVAAMFCTESLADAQKRRAKILEKNITSGKGHGDNESENTNNMKVKAAVVQCDDDDNDIFLPGVWSAVEFKAPECKQT